MNFNVKKCFKLLVTRKAETSHNKYTMKGKTLADVPNNPYLGIEFQSNLKWDIHINNIVSKANKILGFLRRNLSHCPAHVKAQAYFTLVRPHLEYASCAWDPHSKQDISKIEMVQRQALRFVCGVYARTPGTVTSLYEELNWHTLQQRRETQRLCMFYKILNNAVAVPLPSSVQRVNRSGRRKQQFIQVGAHSDSYRLSFFPQTLCDCQAIPFPVRQLPTLDLFKNALNAKITNGSW